MVESVKIYSIPQEAHTRYAHDSEARETALSRDVAASLFVSSAATIVDRGPKPSAFDLLFSVTPQGIVAIETPPEFYSQLRMLAFGVTDNLFGSSQNIDSMLEVITNVVKEKGEQNQNQEENEHKDGDSVKLKEMMQQLKNLYQERAFVYAKMGSLIQG